MSEAQCPVTNLEGASIVTDGSVLIALGGKDIVSGQLNPAVYTCRSNVFMGKLWNTASVSGQAPEPSCWRTATLVGERVFILGGQAEDGFSEENIFVISINPDLSTEGLVWSVVRAFGAKKTPGRIKHSASRVKERYIAVFGGENAGKPLNDLQLLDTNAVRWESKAQKGEIPSPRYGHSTVVVGSKMYLFGGTDGTKFFSDFYALNLDTFEWTLLAGMGDSLSPRAYHGCVSVGVKLFIHGGTTPNGISNDISCYNIKDNKWTIVKADLPSNVPRTGHLLCVASERSPIVHVVGGSRKNPERDPYLSFDSSRVTQPDAPEEGSRNPPPMRKASSEKRLVSPPPQRPMPPRPPPTSQKPPPEKLSNNVSSTSLPTYPKVKQAAPSITPTKASAPPASGPSTTPVAAAASTPTSATSPTLSSPRANLARPAEKFAKPPGPSGRPRPAHNAPPIPSEASVTEDTKVEKKVVTPASPSIAPASPSITPTITPTVTPAVKTADIKPKIENKVRPTHAPPPPPSEVNHPTPTTTVAPRTVATPTAATSVPTIAPSAPTPTPSVPTASPSKVAPPSAAAPPSGAKPPVTPKKMAGTSGRKSILKPADAAPFAKNHHVGFNDQLSFKSAPDYDENEEEPEEFCRTQEEMDQDEDEPMPENFMERKKGPYLFAPDGRDYQTMYEEKNKEAESLSDRIEGLCGIIDESMEEIGLLKMKVEELEKEKEAARLVAEKRETELKALQNKLRTLFASDLGKITAEGGK
ncbi:hypothetical protein PROFUN_02397 [Planoprotostelium fungivorum]|uniref:Uncharacterized protein n=1 Tax=Planoprotostelium fungivorum TaxID=1890364 RepID=A0A2P6NUP9_9EUKA|nr:hypothetical protein PROFUN_02397 [Planoprotostelium fungivorum]